MSLPVLAPSLVRFLSQMKQIKSPEEMRFCFFWVFFLCSFVCVCGEKASPTAACHLEVTSHLRRRAKDPLKLDTAERGRKGLGEKLRGLHTPQEA